MKRDAAFFATSAFAFVASAAGTVYLCRSMPGGMPMPGGWTMSMAWMRMPGQGWLGAALSFLAMWVAMMIAMMLPSLLLTLRGYRTALRMRGMTRLGGVTALVAAGYFLVWSALGALVYPFGIALATLEMQSRPVAKAVPVAAGLIVLVAGGLQLSRWKARQLNGCRLDADCCAPVVAGPRGAWQHGVRAGIRCALCCAAFTTVLLVAGVMNLGAMAAVTAGITFERLAPRPKAVARAIGVVLVACGFIVIARATMA